MSSRDKSKAALAKKPVKPVKARPSSRFGKKKPAKPEKKTFGLTRLQRMYKHILEASLDRGLDLTTAKRIAAGKVNQYRAKQAKAGKGPKLVGQGGSRRQWYPGKKMPKEMFICLVHGRKFRSEGTMLRHYGSGKHGLKALGK
jgi:hypothetical protein